MISIRTALVRPPAANFTDGLTTAGLGAPDVIRALDQHARYVRALQDAGARVVSLDPDFAHPDATFVEDTSVITPAGAILARPGAPSRRGEVAAIQEVLAPLAPRLRSIEPPGTLDGGDVLDAGSHVFVGISERTNEEGARQLAAYLAEEGLSSSCIEIRSIPGLLHLKTGISWLGERRVLAIDAIAEAARERGYEVIPVLEEEAYAANSVLVNGRLLVPAGSPRTGSMLAGLGYRVVALEMSEFRKMDGGLSCLSLRLPF
jgi:dimethylargininase